jgi:hypothetical protein
MRYDLATLDGLRTHVDEIANRDVTPEWTRAFGLIVGYALWLPVLPRDGAGKVFPANANSQLNHWDLSKRAPTEEPHRKAPYRAQS